MRQASKKGACASPDREKAPRLQPEGPEKFSTRDPGDSAGRPQRQEANTERVRLGADGSRLITNYGHIIKAIGKVHELVNLRHGAEGCTVDEARGYFTVLAHLEVKAEAADPSFVPDLHHWADRHLKTLSQADRAEIRRHVRRYPVRELTQRWLGTELGLRDNERITVGFYDAEAIGMTDEERAERKRAKAREYSAAFRKRQGSTPRTECLGRRREPGTPKSTFYDGEARSRQA